jgi:hypothetical protein
MEKSTKEPIKAEIMGDRLIIDGEELRLEGLKSLVDFMKPKEFIEEIASLTLSLAQIGALMSEVEIGDTIDHESLRYAFPSYNCLFALKVLSNSLKEM